MVMVLVAMGMGLILVGVLMNIAMLNYQMKVTEYKSKDNFYSAEVVMDQIHAGLELEVSDSVAAAYSKTMQYYGMSGSTEATRKTSFKENYIKTLRERLQDGADDTKYLLGKEEAYDATSGMYTKGLLAYLDSDLAEMYRAGMGVANARSTNIIRVTCADGNYTMETTTSGIVLKGLKVVYVDDTGFYSEIQTDIEIGYPDVALQEASVIPNVFEYSMIADTALVNRAAKATIRDSIYAGTDGVKISSGRLDFDGAQYLVTPGEITVDKGTQVNFYNGTVWTEGIHVDGGAVNKTFAASYSQPQVTYYVGDDLKISGKNSEVYLSGEYLGFNGTTESPDADDLTGKKNSSAIIVNGSSTTLNLSRLDRLVLGGNAYIATGNSDEVHFEESESNAAAGMTGGQNKNVLLGNSLAVKTDQIAFLAPAECLGTSGGQTLIGKNPMSAAEYQRWMALKTQYADYKLLDEMRTVNLLGKSLSSYFGTDTGVHYQTVFQTINGESICYVYLKMDEKQAAAYYRDYAEAAQSSLIRYAAKYQNNILVNTASGATTTRGNLYTYNKNTATLSIVPEVLTADSQANTDFESRRTQISKNYSSLCSKLTLNANSISDAEKNFSVYHNLINTTSLNSLAAGERKVYQSGNDKAIVINNKGGEALKVQQSSDKVKLVIASGDVEVQGSFSGLIIADGTITLLDYTGAELSADKAAVTRLLQMVPADGSDTVSLIEKYFINGSRYVFNRNNDGGSSYMNLADVIAYRNWSKQ